MGRTETRGWGGGNFVGLMDVSHHVTINHYALKSIYVRTGKRYGSKLNRARNLRRISYYYSKVKDYILMKL